MAKLEEISAGPAQLSDAFGRVWELHEGRDLSLRTAALVAGIRQVAAALDARGLYP